jgi:hypothetical protein
LIVRDTSEDVVTGHLFGALQVLNPRWWLPDLLNAALGTFYFRRQVYRGLRIDLWQNKAVFPRGLLPWEEGSTQVDVTITWENPPTTVFVEMKYGSDLSAGTSQNRGQHGFPSDQLVRNVRVGLLECGYYRLPRLFPVPRRDFVMLVVTPRGNHPLVARYRDPAQLRAAIPHSQLTPQLPGLPFVGELSYPDVVRLLLGQRKWLTRPERVVTDRLVEYLRMKAAAVCRRGTRTHHGSLFEQARQPQPAHPPTPDGSGGRGEPAAGLREERSS